MNRVLLGLLLVAGLITGAGGGVCYWLFNPGGTPEIPPPEFHASEKPLPTQAEFDGLARTDPVAMLAAGLSRYEREVKGGFRATLEKQERVYGKLQDIEVIDLAVRDDPPAVLMKWRQGGPGGVGASLFSQADFGEQIKTWRPKAWVAQDMTIDLKGTLARTSSRYCIRDSGLFRGSLRTKTAWEAVQAAGTFRFEYLGTRAAEKAGGRVCHAIRRTCDPEADSFSLDEAQPTDPKVIARDGFNDILILVDAERWLQVGTELYRRGGGKDELIGSYYFRDIELNPAFPANQFTVAGMKGK